ncbi:uncharacterized protein B0H18DRAFT_616762 [Fomitopsis serialis]|uniref:uncharacterized protein n=1 Tax=Fomitopsis serialis TaxID=139415 RepID=UPI002008950C|nr:uncharacterized protein B0H18DRAFT_616762 [Neoantrodia serialis]KAH9920069.1 hypothetical protein B0H18DRAFT_616762 [Neoantrodia serialis]
MPIVSSFFFAALVLIYAAFNGKDVILDGLGKVQNAMDVALQSFQLPMLSLSVWDYGPPTPPGSSLELHTIFGEGEYTAGEYLDWYVSNGTSTLWPGDAPYNISSLDWFVEDDYTPSGLSGSGLGLALDSADDLNGASYLNATDPRLRCYIDVDFRVLPSAPSSSTVGTASSTDSPTESHTSEPESLITSSATAVSETTTTARCFIGAEYVASATGSFVLPTSTAVSEPTIVYGPSPSSASPELRSAVPCPTAPVDSFVPEEGGKQDTGSGLFSFVFACLEAFREFLGAPQHKFYPIIVLPVPALFAWWLDGGFEKEADDTDDEQEPVEQEQHKREGRDKHLSFDAALRSSDSDSDFEVEEDSFVAAATWAGEGINSSVPF